MMAALVPRRRGVVLIDLPGHGRSADVPEDEGYGITRALWHPSTRRLLDNGHPKARQIDISTALDGVVVPLHPGAQRYYTELGLALPGKAD